MSAMASSIFSRRKAMATPSVTPAMISDRRVMRSMIARENRGVRPEGFELQTEFLDVREEQELLAGIAWGEVRMHGVTARRRVKQFGWHYSFDSYRLTLSAPLPEELVEVRRRAAEVAQVSADEFAE